MNESQESWLVAHDEDHSCKQTSLLTFNEKAWLHSKNGVSRIGIHGRMMLTEQVMSESRHLWQRYLR